MLYEKLLAEFSIELSRLKLTTPDFYTEIETCHKLCTQTLNNMRNTIVVHGFKDQEEEVYFFKEIYVEPMGYLIYYTEVSSYLVNKPKNNKQERLKYLKKQVTRVDEFLSKQIDFLIYVRSKNTHLDPFYFTREHLKHNAVMHRYPYLKDEYFDTDKGFILAKIRGWGLYVAYLKNESIRIHSDTDYHTKVEENITTRYTDRPVEAAELIYALVASNSFDQGFAKISEVVRAFSSIMGLEPKEIYRKLDDIKNRKEKVIYLQKLIDNFRKWLSDQDAL